MPFELKVIADPGSATECGSCAGSGHTADESVVCVFFGHKPLVWTWRNPEDFDGGDYGRLPECIAAEKAQEGAEKLRSKKASEQP